jgi:hypothetical protein
LLTEALKEVDDTLKLKQDYEQIHISSLLALGHFQEVHEMVTITKMKQAVYGG